MSSFSTLSALLELVQIVGGSISTRIRIQKEAYLLAASGATPFRIQSFSYHHYGPFSRELSDTLQFAVSAGLLEEVRESFSEGTQRYRYELTSAGRSFTAESQSSLEPFRNNIQRFENEHWRSLELASTVDFLKRNQISYSTEEAFEKALRLKPETSPFRDQAKDLLDQLAI